MTSRIRTGIFGGTFDPIHLGHLDVVETARVALTLDEVLIVPTRLPPHRSARPRASSYHRFAMVALAVADRPGLLASDLELRIPRPSFTSATLHRLHRRGYQPSQLFFITGADAFAEIATWRDYPDILDACHFVVVSRPGTPAAELPRRLHALATRMLGPSSGDNPIRGAVTTLTTPSIFLINVPTTNVSASQIRQRLTAGRPVAGLVPAAVEAYIRRHRLYHRADAATELHEQR